MTAKRPAIRTSDLALAVALAALCPPAWLVPERRWPALAEKIVAAGWPKRRRLKRLSHIRSAFGELEEGALQRIERESSASWILRQLQLLRAYRPGGWHPRIALEGRERIEQALEQGAGVILWSGAFRFSDLVTKIGLHRAGYRLTHLSMPDHGWSSTRLGVRWLNPIWVRIETRYLHERVVIDPSDPKDATERIRRALVDNGIVSITAIRGAARRPHSIRILNARYRVGMGAPMLAHDTGAVLLPVFTLRQPDGSFRIEVEEPIAIRPELPRLPVAMAAVEELGRRIERHLRSAPGQWNWWDMETAAPSGKGVADAPSVSNQKLQPGS